MCVCACTHKHTHIKGQAQARIIKIDVNRQDVYLCFIFEGPITMARATKAIINGF